MDQQPILLRVLEANRTPISITGLLQFLPPDQRSDIRRPLRLNVASYVPVDLALSKATQALRSRLDIHLSRIPIPAVHYISQVFTAARDVPPPSISPPLLADTYDLLSPAGYSGLYQDLLGTTDGLPTTGLPIEWVPELAWITSPSCVFTEPLSHDAVDLLFQSVDIQSCFRVADPVCGSPVLAEVVQHRYQRALLSAPNAPAALSNWLSPLHYRRLATKGPIDFTFLYPPLSIADLALTLAATRSRVGVAMWVPSCYLSNLSHTRLLLLNSYKSQRRLAVIHSWSCSNLWVCIFTSSSHRTRMLTPSSALTTSWTSL
jgi:hypothetical protein